MAYQYLHRAMAMRYDTRYGLLLKKPADPIPAYDNWKESTTLEVNIILIVKVKFAFKRLRASFICCKFHMFLIVKDIQKLSKFC